MNEIKFRAWVLDGNIRRMVDWYPEFFSDMSIVTGWSSEFPDNTDQDVILMQYTGVKDANGVEIYDGDILQHLGETDNVSVSIVKWDALRNGWSHEEPDHDWTLPYVGGKQVVIGNIYENPDLIKHGGEVA